MNTKTFGFIAAAAMGVGSFLPWATLTAAFLGTISVNGIDGGDGWVFVALAVLVAVGAAKGNAAMMVIAGGLGVAFGIYEVVDINDRIGDVGDMAAASIGFGLWLCLAGSVGAVVAGVIALNERAKAAPPAATEPEGPGEVA